jgi:outer membrane phospholipase A
MKRFLCFLLIALTPGFSVAETFPDWVLASSDARAQAGDRFRIAVIAAEGETPPDEISVRARFGPTEVVLPLKAEGPAAGARRLYVGTMPEGALGSVALQLVGRSSSTLLIAVSARPDTVQALTGRGTGIRDEPPLSENDPMYLVFGAREGYSARFQLSFKYRLFDQAAGVGRAQPWLAGLYFGYTQNSLWDLSSQSRPFRDTSYRPSLFWRWQRTDAKTWVDALRVGFEHESNGRDGSRSRSIDTVFLRPEWRWRALGGQLEFTPKLYAYLDKEDNPDIHQYRGYTDWRLRYDSEGDWIATGVARLGRAGKGSLLVDLSRRTRDIRFGPVGGYLHLQYFTGYGEDILDYNARRKSQLRIGVAIVP